MRSLLLLVIVATGCRDPNVVSNTVSVVDNAFSPQTLTVDAGSNVTWVWNGVAPHDVVFSDGGGSSTIQTSGQWDRVFPVAGSYNYLCTLHAGMTGRIVVR